MGKTVEPVEPLCVTRETLSGTQGQGLKEASCRLVRDFDARALRSRTDGGSYRGHSPQAIVTVCCRIAGDFGSLISGLYFVVATRANLRWDRRARPKSPSW